MGRVSGAAAGYAACVLVLAAAGSAAAEWSAWSSTDEMSGEVRKGVVSAWTKPTRAMSGYQGGGWAGLRRARRVLPFLFATERDS